MFDKERIKNNFGRAACVYEDHAVLQRMVAEKLVKVVVSEIKNAEVIADLGAGTGFISKIINDDSKKIFQLDIAPAMLAVNPYSLKFVGDIENLPFVNDNFDLTLSSLAFQWVDAQLAISEALRVTKKNGVVAFSIIADGSLEELKNTAKNLNIDLAVNQFIGKDELEKIISTQTKNFAKNFELKEEEIILDYDDLFDLLHSIKAIGASYGSFKKTSNLTKKQFELLNNFYLKNFNYRNRIRASWRVIYAIIKKM